MKKIKILIISIIFSLSIINISIAGNNIMQINSKKECIIINVDDWDTFDLLCTNNNVKEYIYNVRTLWVNAPDLYYNWNNRFKHCYYDEAKNIIELIKNKKRVLMIEFFWSDLCKDEYKWCRNLVRMIDKKTWLDINELLIIKWYNFSWIKFSMIPRKIKTRYFIAEKRAKRNKNWLWWKCEILYNDEYNYLDSHFPNKMTN